MPAADQNLNLDQSPVTGGQQMPSGTQGVVPPPPPTPPQVEPAAVPDGPKLAPSPAGPEATVMAPSSPKRRFPKKILVVAVGLVLIIMVAFLVIRFIFPIFSGRGGKDVVWWGLWENDSIIMPLIAEYEDAHPGVNITYVKQSKEEYRERLTNAIAQGNGPDLFRIHNTWVPMFIKDLDLLPEDVMSATEFKQSFYPVAVKDLTTSVGIVGIPLEYDGLALFINEEIFSTYSKSPPKTWNEFKETAIELTIKNNKGEILQSGAALGITENVDHWPEILGLMMVQNGANLARPTGDLAEGALNYYRAFAQTDKVWDGTLPNSTTAFAAGKLAMYFGPSWRALNIVEMNPTLDFRVVPVPQLPKETGQEPDITYASYWVEAVLSQSKSKETAWDFLKFLSDRQSLEKFYQNASQVRTFGEPYPRLGMRDLLLSDPIVGGVIALAPNAKSWYLASRTFDGPTGINSQLADYFEDAVNSGSLESAAAGVSQVLTQYGIQ